MLETNCGNDNRNFFLLWDFLIFFETKFSEILIFYAKDFGIFGIL